MGDIDELITRLQDSNMDIRSDTVETLAETSDSRAVAPSITALQNESESVRGRALQGLKDIGPPTIPHLIVALKTETGGKMPIIQLEEIAKVERDASVRRAAERILKK